MKAQRTPHLQTLIALSLLLFMTGCSSVKTVDHREFQAPQQDVLITNISALSADGSRMLTGQNVLLRNGLIVSISASQTAPAGVTIIDGDGKFLIPGLIDSHAHLQDSENDLLVYLAHGITGIREMSGNARHLAWAAQVENGRPGPSIEVSSEKISSKAGLSGFINSLFWTRINVSSEQAAERLIGRLHSQGYANAKISSDISRAMYLAITKAASEQGMDVAGHIPGAIDFEEFLQSEHREIAHIEELVKLLNREFGYFTVDNSAEFLSFAGQRSREMASDLQRRGIAVNTTLWYMQSIPKQVASLPELIADSDLSFTNPQRATEWGPEANEFANNHTGLVDWWEVFSQANEVVFKALLENDVTLLAGTDAMTTMVVPGASMHQELSALVSQGMSPQHAIASASAEPARWMGIKAGAITPGYAADLLILNRNPLDDIAALSDIDTVIKAGRVYPRATLDLMLDRVRTQYRH
jgi:hypothetical protein